MFTRRGMIAVTASLSVAACAGGVWRAPHADAAGQVEALVADGRVPAAALVVRRAGRTVFSSAAGLAQGAGGEAPPVTFGATTKMRVASVSKMAVALAAHKMAARGEIDLDADVSVQFDPPLRHPHFPEAPITLRQMFSHTGALQDPEVYWVDAPGRTEDMFTRQMWRPADKGPPGGAFLYANIGYGLAAHVLERATKWRLDQLVAYNVFPVAASDCGVNWSGVSAASRRAGATLYRFEDGAWRVQADGVDVLTSDAPTLRSAPGFDLSTYVPGTNGTLFSPQGGLRASLEDLARLARNAGRDPGLAEIVWRHDAARMGDDTDGGYFSAYTAGAQVHPPTESPIEGLGLIGHHGEAFGLYSGAFHVPALDAEFAFAVTGTRPDGTARHARHPAVVEATAPLWDAAAQVLRRL